MEQGKKAREKEKKRRGKKERPKRQWLISAILSPRFPFSAIVRLIDYTWYLDFTNSIGYTDGEGVFLIVCWDKRYGIAAVKGSNGLGRAELAGKWMHFIREE